MNELSKERLNFYATTEPPFGYTGSDIRAMARELLARRKERAEPVGEVVLGSRDDEGNYPHAHVICLAGEGCADWDNFPDGFKLYAQPPAPVVPDEQAFYAWTRSDVDLSITLESETYMGIAKASWEACRAAMLTSKEAK